MVARRRREPMIKLKVIILILNNKTVFCDAYLG